MEMISILAALCFLLAIALVIQAWRARSNKLKIADEMDLLEAANKALQEARGWYTEPEEHPPGDYVCLLNTAQGPSHIVCRLDKEGKWWMETDEMTDLVISFTSIPGYGLVLRMLVDGLNKRAGKLEDLDGDTAC